jgi:Ca-activated chloride channel family protein
MFGLTRFEDPLWLICLVTLPVILYWYLLERRRSASIRFTQVSEVKRRVPVTLRSRLRPTLLALKLLGLGVLIMAMARPQAGTQLIDLSAEGIDIMLTLDVSSSMEAKDLGAASRLEVAKKVVADFISGRISDRVGMVVFAAQSFTQCPLTLDYDILVDFLKDIRIAEEEWDGTAIGMALINACNRLKDSDADSKVIILLTDGVNNAGEIDPMTAADAAAAIGVRVYSIGVGRQVSARARGRVEFDEETLRSIAERTGGKYYHAHSEEKLQEIYAEIGELEKTEVTSQVHVDYSDRFASWVWFGLLVLVAEFALANTVFRKVP